MCDKRFSNYKKCLKKIRMPPWGVPGVSGPPPATYSGQPTGPNGQPVRAMFPSAAGPNGASQATGNEQYKATFPAYSE